MASHVAEFETPAQVPQAVPPHNPTHPSVQPHASHHPHHPPPHSYPPHMHPQYFSYPNAQAPLPGPQIKTEPVDPRFVLHGPSIQQQGPPAYNVQPLAGPQIPQQQPPRPGGQVISFQPQAPTARYQQPQAPVARVTNGRIPQTDGPAAAAPVPSRIPQVDGPSSSSSSGSPSPPPPAYAPRGAAHPSLPQPISRADQDEGDEAINSDLDDSDSEGEREDGVGGGGETDIVFCTYDKVRACPITCIVKLELTHGRFQVARVKNKWKCILKDGMIHVNGKDYLFAKCTG